MLEQIIDVAVIGAGPAGLAAAIKAREAGAEKVTIIERAEQPGGLLHQCIHNGFGLVYFNEDLTGPEYARRFIEKAMDLKIDMELESMVLDLTAAKRITISSKEGLRTLLARSVVLAMGCRERTRHQIMIPGTRPAGVFTAVVEILPYIGGLIRNEVQCVHDFNIPLFLEHTVTEIIGLKRIEAVTIARVDQNQEPIAGTERTIECDTLLTSVGLIPENELSLKAGVALDPITGGPFVSDTMETSVAGIFAGGNVVHVNDLVDSVTSESEVAGAGAADYALGKTTTSQRKISLKAGENIRYIVPHTIGTEKEVTLSMRVREPGEKVRIRIGDVFTKSLRVVKPSEMLKVNLTTEQLGKIAEETGEIEIICEKRG
jgi:thioredoxin reductase